MFIGDLEHLPIVDLIQLLHSTRKTGTLCLKSKKGESQLVFNDGYIVSANHLNNSVRIGQILVDMKAISAEQLETALQEQKKAGSNRAPLIATLIENGLIDKDVAFQGLEMLIEMTIVEVLTWTYGTFELEMDKLSVSDEYRYFPETLKQVLNMNTQSILMDALRIYDERKRDGTLPQEPFPADDADDAGVSEQENSDSQSPIISAFDLGLDDLDSLEKKVPDVFTAVKVFDPAESYRQKLREEFSDIPIEKQEQLYSYLLKFSEQRGNEASGNHTVAVILLSRDKLIISSVMSICQHAGIHVFTTDEQDDVDVMIDQSVLKSLFPVLMVDMPPVESSERNSTIKFLHQKREKYRHLHIVQLVYSDEFDYCLEALANMATIFPRPNKMLRKQFFVEDTIKFLETFSTYITSLMLEGTSGHQGKLHQAFMELAPLKEAPDISLVVLKFVSLFYQRAITFIINGKELIAERSIGIQQGTNSEVSPPLKFKIPLSTASVFEDVINSGRNYTGSVDDATFQAISAQIGSPRYPVITLVPLKAAPNRVAAIVYADCKDHTPKAADTELLDMIGSYASLVLENSLQRKKLEKAAESK